MLRLESLSCGYGEMTAVQDLTLNIPDGEITAMLGANGAGKSSTIMCIAGHVTVIGGRILYDDKEITHASPMTRVKAGFAVVPEGRRLFPDRQRESDCRTEHPACARGGRSCLCLGVGQRSLAGHSPEGKRQRRIN